MNPLHCFWWFLLAMVLGSFVLPVLRIIFGVMLNKPHDEVARDGIGCLVCFWELGFGVALVLLVASIVKLLI